MQGDGQKPTRTGSQITALLRCYAFLLLDFAYQSCSKRNKDQDRLSRNFKVGLKACKACLDKDQLDVAAKLIHRCGQYAAAEASPLVSLTKGAGQNDEEPHIEDLVSELRLLRAAHAWKVNRLDLAEHFYTEFANTQRSQASVLAEKAAELTHEIGAALLRQHTLEPAAKWLQRAVHALDASDVSQLSQDAPDLRLAITVSLGRLAHAIFVRNLR